MRVAAIDLGTNSTRLLVAEVAGGRVDEVVRRLTITRLGEGVDASGHLLPEAVARVRDCLARYRADIVDHGVEHVLAIATSAVRDADNGDDVLRGIEADFGWQTRLLDGHAEAETTLRGVTSDRSLDRETLVVDIGGGSTELLLGGPAGVSFTASLQLGCVRMTERYLHHDPPGSDELVACARHARDLLPSLEVDTAIGVAGTVTSTAAIDLGLTEHDAERVHGHRVSRGAVDDVLALLAGMPLEERRRVPGLEPARAPVIVGGLVVLREVLDAYGLAEIEASERDVLHGAVLLAAELPRPDDGPRR